MKVREVFMRAFVRNTIVICLLLSLLIHLGVWTGLRLSSPPKNSTETDKVEIVILDQSQIEKQQIVEQADKPVNDEIPEDSKYLSAHNQRVVQETRAANQGDFRNSAASGQTQKPQQEKMAQNPKQKAKTSTDGNLPTLSDLRPKFDPSVVTNENKATGTGGQASQTNDYLKDTPPSLETVLSTREFVYYTYYQRIRTQIRQFWEPSIRAKVRKIFASGRNIASEHDHITRVIIVLDRAGNLKNVQIVGESGVKDLDDAAVEAFRAAEPFPNPPKGIVDADGTIKINWDFILEADNDTGIRFQRYARR